MFDLIGFVLPKIVKILLDFHFFLIFLERKFLPVTIAYKAMVGQVIIQSFKNPFCSLGRF